MADEAKIVFRVGDENRIVVENLKEKGIVNSIFSNQYRKALHIIDSYLKHRPEGCTDLSNDYSSNVFAFIGERGSGKTSCMVSIADYLKSGDVAETYPKIKKNHFISLRLIDPTFFCDEKESIVWHIMSQLLQFYKNIKREKKRGHENYDQSLEQKIVDKFSEVNSNIECLRNDKTMTPDDLEYLNQLSSAVDLKNNIRNLVSTILKYNGTPDALIVIPIDDIDMNKKGVTKMVEDIRKYLSNEFFLVLVAVHLNQLTLIEKQEFYAQYGTLLNNNQIRPDRIDKMTEKFLDKFLPQAHRILMPEVYNFLTTPMQIEEDGKKPLSFVTVRQGVCELIFVKTRYLFYNTNDTASRIIPCNLRDLRHLISLLYNMADYDKKADDRQRNDASGLYNKKLFKEYLFGTWSRENLDEEMRQDLMSLLGITDVTLFNSRVLEILCKYFNNLDSLRTGNSPIATEILNGLLASGNNAFNFSIGDSLNLIFLLERMISDGPKRNLLFLMKTLYSIKLYEYYDERTICNAVNNNEEELLLDDRVTKYNLSNYEKLVAGGFINPSFYSLIPQETGKYSRQCRSINLTRLNQLIAECVDNWNDISEEKLNLIEFFIINTSRPIDTKNGTNNITFVEPGYRRRNDPFYATNLTSTMTRVCFDANAFLFNLPRLKSCFERFPRGGELFEKIDSESQVENLKSIWAKLKLATIRRNKSEEDLTNFKYDRWLSWTSIRNAEILQQLLNILTFKKNETRQNAVNKDVLVDYYRRIANYSLNNYDKDAEGHYFGIDYSFVNVIADALEHSDDETFDAIYHAVSDSVIPYEKLFDVSRRQPYSKNHVSKKLEKYIRENKINIPREMILQPLNSIQGDTIPVQKVKDLVYSINSKIEENGGAQEDA